MCLFVISKDAIVLNCLLFNARSIANKLYELHNLLYEYCYDCILITESWLSSMISDGHLDPENKYIVMRYDRSSGRGGGVCVLIKKCRNVVQVTMARTYADLEIIVFDILDVRPVVRFFVVYRPPHYDKDAENYVDMLINCFTAYTHESRSHVIVGDINLPRMRWNSGCCPGDYVNTSFLNFVLMHGYSQLVDFSTRETNLLDVILTDDDNIITSVKQCPPVGYSDHVGVEFAVTLMHAGYCAPHKPSKARYYMWQKGDFDGMICYLESVDWTTLICNNPSAESMWNAFVQMLWFAINLFVPSYTKDTHGNTRTMCRRPKSRKVRKCSVKKRKLWNKLRLHPQDPSLRHQYRECVRQWRVALRADEVAHEQHIIDANDLGAFYRFVNKRLAGRSSVGAIVADGSILTDNHQKANAFNKYFASVGVSDDGTVPPIRNTALSETLDSVTFSETDVLKSINKLKCNLSAGPVACHRCYLRNLSTALPSLWLCCTTR